MWLRQKRNSFYSGSDSNTNAVTEEMMWAGLNPCRKRQWETARHFVFCHVVCVLAVSCPCLCALSFPPTVSLSARLGLCQPFSFCWIIPFCWTYFVFHFDLLYVCNFHSIFFSFFSAGLFSMCPDWFRVLLNGDITSCAACLQGWWADRSDQIKCFRYILWQEKLHANCHLRPQRCGITW